MDGNQLGLMTRDEALAKARDLSLDLVEVATEAKPPVCRIMDFGKYKYVQNKRACEAKKRQHSVDVKEIKLRPKIAEHDYLFKMRHIEKFLMAGDRVKVTMIFRGRERAHQDLGMKVLERVAQDATPWATSDGPPKHQGGTIVMVLMPHAAKG